MAAIKQSCIPAGESRLYTLFMVTVSVDPDERAVLLKWKKRGDTMSLIRMKAEAVLYASMGVDAEIISSTLDRSPRTVSDWLRDWNAARLRSAITGHAGNEMRRN
jgi:hypothetical protein